MKVSEFTKRELYHFQAFCNFTPEEEKLFNLRSRDHTLEECAEELNISDSTVKRMHKRMMQKIESERKHMTPF